MSTSTPSQSKSSAEGRGEDAEQVTPLLELLLLIALLGIGFLVLLMALPASEDGKKALSWGGCCLRLAMEIKEALEEEEDDDDDEDIVVAKEREMVVEAMVFFFFFWFFGQ